MVASYCPPPPATTRTWAPPRPRPRPNRRRVAPAVYRRRRLGLAVLVLGVVLAGGEARESLGGGSLTIPEAVSPAPRPLAVRPVSRTTHLVAPGDTLWSIARRAQPTGDIRPLVDAMAARRGGRPVQVGERVEVWR